jgi:hypothetical protein
VEKVKNSRILVEKQVFDRVLGILLETKPVPRNSIKSTRKRGSKKPIMTKK